MKAPETPATLRQTGFVIALGAAMTLSAWSLYWVARHWGQPQLVAALTSAGFDGAAMAASGYAIRFAEKGLKGWPARVTVLALAGLSSFLNAQHPILAGDPWQAIALYAVPPLTAVTLFELHVRWKLTGGQQELKPKLAPKTETPPETALTRGEGRRGGKVKSEVREVSKAEVRRWAAGKGLKLGDRGPIPDEVVAEFKAELNGGGRSD